MPANHLELALWMESDRMGFLLPAMTQAKFDNQRESSRKNVGKASRIVPMGWSYETILAAMYPPDHPYSWPTIGSMTDLNRASREDIADFFRRYYHPGQRQPVHHRRLQSARRRSGWWPNTSAPCRRARRSSG